MSSTERQGSWHAYDVVVERDTMIPVRDGVLLATDIYFPSSGGRAAPDPFQRWSNAPPMSAAAVIPKANGIRSRTRRPADTTRSNGLPHNRGAPVGLARWGRHTWRTVQSAAA
jgi:hypothetical protein